VRELGERRELRRAKKYNATENALQLADELGVDIAELDGSGSEGRVTVRDVRKAQEA
jgi:pyruvate/2-oxoglutarate dehydrogenase complex dihydrolipoamide acyltransferase (E2) component